MLIKSADDRSEDIAELNALLGEPLPTTQKRRIEEDLHKLEKGAWGEQNAAYFLNFHFASSENHLILHDLTIRLSDDRTAQIDHLLINRFQDFYVLESKNWTQLTVDKTGACTTWANRRIIGVESPLEQCKRHADILTITLQGYPELKALTPRYQTIPRVLIAPSCHLKAPHHTEWYVKADAFHSIRAKEIDNESTLQNILDLPRFISKKTLMKLGETLLALHHPFPRDWRAKFVPTPTITKVKQPTNKVVSSIEGLADYVPRWGDDWFVLKAEPTEATKKILKRAGYRAKQEKGEWVWRLKT